MAAPTTALEPPTPPKPLAASLECPRKDEKEGVESFSGEVGGDTIEGEEDGGLEESLENGHKTNGESFDEASEVSAKWQYNRVVVSSSTMLSATRWPNAPTTTVKHGVRIQV